MVSQSPQTSPGDPPLTSGVCLPNPHPWHRPHHAGGHVLRRGAGRPPPAMALPARLPAFCFPARPQSSFPWEHFLGIASRDLFFFKFRDPEGGGGGSRPSPLPPPPEPSWGWAEWVPCWRQGCPLFSAQSTEIFFHPEIDPKSGPPSPLSRLSGVKSIDCLCNNPAQETARAPVFFADLSADRFPRNCSDVICDDRTDNEFGDTSM